MHSSSLSPSCEWDRLCRIWEVVVRSSALLRMHHRRLVFEVKISSQEEAALTKIVPFWSGIEFSHWAEFRKRKRPQLAVQVVHISWRVIAFLSSALSPWYFHGCCCCNYIATHFQVRTYFVKFDALLSFRLFCTIPLPEWPFSSLLEGHQLGSRFLLLLGLCCASLRRRISSWNRSSW